MRLDYAGQCAKIDRFESFRQKSPRSTSAAERILIISNELTQSVFFNSSFHLCALLKRQGCNVDLLLVDGKKYNNKTIEAVSSQCGLELSDITVLPKKDKLLNSPTSELLENSYYINKWLLNKTHSYSAVLSVESMLDVYYALLARETSIAHQATNFYVFASSTSYLDTVKGSVPVTSPITLNRYYVERRVLELCDAFVSNNQHCLNWISQTECPKSVDKYFYQDVPVDNHSFLPEQGHSSLQKLESIVFVLGEHCLTELSLCCEALERLESRHNGLCFIVPSSTISQYKQLLKKFTQAYSCPVKIIEQHSDQSEWRSALTDARVFIVPNTRRINSVVLSLIKASNKPLLADTIVEDSQLGEYKIRTFVHNSEIIKEYLKGFLSFSKTHVDKLSGDQAWLDLLTLPPSRRKESSYDFSQTSVSVCITHRNRGDLLLRAINSILEQTYPCSEIIVVDDGSTDPRALHVIESIEKEDHPIDIRVIRQSNLYVGASRNNGLAAATANYILFMDDDNEAKPEEIETFVKCAIATNADVLTCWSDVFSGESPINSGIGLQTALFVGPNIGVGLFSNPYGDSNMFVRVEAARAIDGFSESYKVGRDDLEFFVRAEMSGLKIMHIPKSLYYYRLSRNRIRKSHINSYSGFARVLQTRTSYEEIHSAQLLTYAQGLSYIIGPWGVNLRVGEYKARLLEYFRLTVAKYPSLYGLARRVRAIFRGK